MPFDWRRLISSIGEGMTTLSPDIGRIARPAMHGFGLSYNDRTLDSTPNTSIVPFAPSIESSLHPSDSGGGNRILDVINNFAPGQGSSPMNIDSGGGFSDTLRNFGNQISNPQNETPGALGELTNLLRNMPKREGLPWWQKIGAIASGVNPSGSDSFYNPERAMAMLDLPYQRKLEDWKTRVNATGTLAGLENEALKENRLYRDQSQKQQLDYLKFLQDIQNDATANKLSEARIRQINDSIAKGDFMSMGRQDDGSILVIDRKTNTPISIPTNNMTEEQRMRLEASIAQSRDAAIERLRQNNRMELEGERGKNRIEAAKERRLERPTRSESSATQEARALVNRAQEVINSNPKLAPYISIMPNNIVQIKRPDGYFGFSGGDDATLNEAYQAVYGKPRTGINAAPGKVRMIAPDGRLLDVPADKVGEMEAKGARRQ